MNGEREREARVYEGKKGVWEGGERCNVAGIVWKKGWVRGREREKGFVRE